MGNRCIFRLCVLGLVLCSLWQLKPLHAQAETYCIDGYSFGCVTFDGPFWSSIIVTAGHELGIDQSTLTNTITNGVSNALDQNNSEQATNIDQNNQNGAVTGSADGSGGGYWWQMVESACTTVMQNVFEPDSAHVNQVKDTFDHFMDWGPYHMVTAVTTAANDTTVSDGKVGGLSFGIPVVSFNDGYGTGIVPGAHQHADEHGFYPNGQRAPVGLVSAGQWYATGAVQPFDFSPVTNLPGWAFVRGSAGALVYLSFLIGLTKQLTPKQVM